MGFIGILSTFPDIVTPMVSKTSLLCALLLTPAAFGHPDAWEKRDSSSFLDTCNQIAKAVSDASQVFFPRK